MASQTLGFENQLRARRQAAGLSQKQLAQMAGITRQAVAAVETDQYSPATSVALQLARALHCRVEDLFSIKRGEEILEEGELLGTLPRDDRTARAQITQVGHRVLVRPMQGIGELATLSASADGLIVDFDRQTRRVKVKLIKDREPIGRKVVVAGCDPAMFLAADYVGKNDRDHLLPCLMGSSLALDALKRGEVHAAGIHLAEEVSDTWKLPDLKEFVGDMELIVVTFAHWEEGFIVRHGNPKKIRSIADLAKPVIKIVNREEGSGARRLLDKQLRANGINPKRVKGYSDIVLSHLEVASRIRAGLADSGISVRSVASICGLDFIPLERERYDLVIPKAYYESVSGLRALLDTIVDGRFRSELEALGGYDTREAGRIVSS